MGGFSEIYSKICCLLKFFVCIFFVLQRSCARICCDAAREGKKKKISEESRLIGKIDLSGLDWERWPLGQRIDIARGKNIEKKNKRHIGP
uniref:Secreted peptide n=1 Tax=Rhipicephalus pulchellus TaxID=72859 RepID=L7LUS2_RHIPC